MAEDRIPQERGGGLDAPPVSVAVDVAGEGVASPPMVPIHGTLAPTHGGEGQGVPPYAVRRALAARIDPCGSGVVVVVQGSRS